MSALTVGLKRSRVPSKAVAGIQLGFDCDSTSNNNGTAVEWESNGVEESKWNRLNIVTTALR